MLFNAEQRQDDWFRDKIFDVCICGAGPAGISLARRLAAKGRHVALLEAGDVDLTEESQACYEGDIVGHEYFPLHHARLRFLGGTSNHWTGFARPFDADDFLALPHAPWNEWPIRKPDLDPYSDETDRILGLRPPYQPFDIFNGRGGTLIPIAIPREEPARFGRKFHDELAASQRISVYLNANLVDIELAPDLRSVSEVIVRSYEREEPFRIRARQFVLCAGGMENPRALLNANRQMPQGIGNQHDLVGRYFADHIIVTVGGAALETRFFVLSHLTPSRQLMIDKGCLNFVMALDPIANPRHWTQQALERASCATSVTQRVAQALLGREPLCVDVRLVLMCQQANNYNSRVGLADSVDRFGLRRIALDWRLSEIDFTTINVAAREVGQRMATTDAGRVQLRPALRQGMTELPKIGHDVVAGYHHMCSTRMSDDPKSGVVDRNCRVHGIENLYIGGSSVFASTAWMNPTYTIVQLALRLADHIDARLDPQ